MKFSFVGPVVSSLLLILASIVSSISDADAADFGQAHPDAPVQLQQFDFMIGEFNRRERTRNQDEWVFPDITENSYLWTLFITLQGQLDPVKEIETRRK